MTENETYECMGMYCTEELPAPGTCSKACDETVRPADFEGTDDV